MTAPDGEDVVELGDPRGRGPRWRPSPAAFVLAAATLLVGLAVGYADGARHAREHTVPPAPSRSAVPPHSAAAFSAGGFPISQSAPRCSVQSGRELQVGLQISNVSPAVVRLRRVDVVLPLGGLRVISQVWGPCGELPTVDQVPGDTLTPILHPGGSAWFTVTFQVLVRCPKPLPVQFTLHYDQQGRPAAIPLPGFPDLGQVPYSRCS